MALSVGTRLGPYEIVALIGVGGMSACGYAALAAMQSRQRRISVSSRRGWGRPSAIEKMLAASPSRGPQRGSRAGVACRSDRWR